MAKLEIFGICVMCNRTSPHHFLRKHPQRADIVPRRISVDIERFLSEF
jgi:hypothetical protein